MSELERELRALDERTAELGENEELPRSKLPGLFRVARGAARSELGAVGAKLGARLADRGLLESTVELARDFEEVRVPLLAALAGRAGAKDAWAVERQAALLATVPLLETVLELTRDPPRLSLPLETLLGLVEARLASSRRDRTSLEVTRGALRLLGPHARDARVAVLAAQTVEAETRRATRGMRGGGAPRLEDPELALAALDLLAFSEPLAVLRVAKKLEKRVDRKKVQERLVLLAEQATAALGASKEDVSDLLAPDLGLDSRGRLAIPLEAGEAQVSIDRIGKVVAFAGMRLAPDEQREVEAARASVERARSDAVERLERALGQGRAWRLDLFRAIFLANPLLRDLASRLVWIAVPSRISFRPGEKGLEDVFGEPIAGVDERTFVRHAHPVELDPDELALWRERLREIGRQPFPQLHRLVRRETEPLDRFVGRQLHQADMAELGKKRGYRGLPLRGDGPWELVRDFPEATLRIVLERIAGQVATPKRKDALRVFDDPEAKPREIRDAAPRARVQKVELAERSGYPAGSLAVAQAEAALDLHLLTDPLEAGTDAWFGEWQKKKFQDPAAFWRDAQLAMLRASEAAADVRAVLARSFEPKVRLEGRLAILGGDDGLYVELATGQAFEGRLRDWVPPWKLAGRAERPELDWPFDPEKDEATVRIVGTIVGCARVLDSRAK